MTIRIKEMEWGSTPGVALLECDCGRAWGHRLYRLRVVCPACGRERNMDRMKDEFLESIGED